MTQSIALPEQLGRLYTLFAEHSIARREAEDWLVRSFRWAYPNGVQWDQVRSSHVELLKRDFLKMVLQRRVEQTRLLEEARAYASERGWNGKDWDALARITEQVAHQAMSAAMSAQYRDGFLDQAELAHAHHQARVADALRELLFA